MAIIGPPVRAEARRSAESETLAQSLTLVRRVRTGLRRGLEDRDRHDGFRINHGDQAVAAAQLRRAARHILPDAPADSDQNAAGRQPQLLHSLPVERGAVAD